MTLCAVVQPNVVPKSLSFSIFPYIFLLHMGTCWCVYICREHNASDMPMYVYTLQNTKHFLSISTIKHTFILALKVRVFLGCSVSYVKFIHLN